jgi:hypothetical protein
MFLSRLNRINKELESRKVWRSYGRKIRAILDDLDCDLTKVTQNDLEVRRWLPRYRNTRWHIAYSSANGIVSRHYLPEDIYYTLLEPRLNNSTYAKVYHDKSVLCFLLGADDCIVNAFYQNHGCMYAGDGGRVEPQMVEEWILAHDEIVFKPSKDSGGGRGVFIGSGSEVLEEIRRSRHSYVIQEVFRQHPVLADLHADSLNTIRFMTLRKDGHIHEVSAVLRIGLGASRVDNMTRGGIQCGVVEGRLNTTAYDGRFRKYLEHPTSHVVFAGLQIPSWPAVCKLVNRCHRKLTEADLVSWDIAIGYTGIPKVVEANIYPQEVNFHQLNNGPVFAPHLSWLFRDFLD